MTTLDQRGQNEVLDFGGFPGRWEITRSTEDTDGELFETQWEIETIPADGPFVHTHPKAEESYEVLAGVLEVYVDGQWIEVSAGETHTVPPGTPHTFKNKTPVEVINIHKPALQHEVFFRRFHRLVTEHGVSLPPNGRKDIILIAMLTNEHKEDIRAVSPPHWVFRLMAGLGTIMRYELPT